MVICVKLKTEIHGSDTGVHAIYLLFTRNFYVDMNYIAWHCTALHCIELI